MKQQYIRLFCILLGISCILSGAIYAYVKTFKDARKEIVRKETLIADEIGNVYKTFYDKATELTENRDKFIEDMSNYFVFYSSMPDEYEKMIKEINKYETLIKESEDISSYLNDKCKTTYSVKEANEKCYAYYINLESSINVFIGDIEYFNSKIEEYNKWIETENKSVIATKQYKELKKYESDLYKEYVDLNKDGYYLGMNSD